jgi:ferredoxin
MNTSQPATDRMIEVVLDKTECCASGMCASIAPTAFKIDPQGYAVVLPGAHSTSRDLLLQAAKSCPTLCISLQVEGNEIDLFT